MDQPSQGLHLARALYLDVIRPSLDAPHAAALIGEGSEVLGYDTERSRDHEWGPRLQLFVPAAAVDRVTARIDVALPERFDGYPTRWFSLSQGRVAHHVEIDTVDHWRRDHLPTLPADPDLADWLAAPQQHLLQLTAGQVFHDDIGQLTALRETYRWYPDDVWRWMLAAQWHLIGNAEPLLGRTIDTGDQRGARLLTAQLVRLIMEMTYLQQRRYQPYPKWFGRGFRELAGSEPLGGLLDTALEEPPDLRPDGPLRRALLGLGAAHNGLDLTDPVEPAIASFAVGVNDAVRPFPVLNSNDFIEALLRSITDVRIRKLPRVGSVDQLTHADDQLINFTSWPAALAGVYRQMIDSPAG